MTLSIRQIAPESNLFETLTLDVIEQVIPPERVKAILQQEQAVEERLRRLSLCNSVYILIGLALFEEQSMASVLATLTHGLRTIWPDDTAVVPQASAFIYRRQQLGSVPVIALFHEICQPLATAQTPGAFRFGLRLMAVDSTIEALPDPPATAAAFGRLAGRKGQRAFPQVRGVYLGECGTHVVIDALFLPCRPNERHGAKLLLGSLSPQMLLMWETGFHDYDFFRLVRQRHTHMLARLPDGPCPQKLKRLADGSWLVELYPRDGKRRRRGEHLQLRLVEYTITDPKMAGYQQTHRLLTALLDPEVAPALDLVCTYHERWEIELVIAEIDTHQRLVQRPARSKAPDGVIQEFFAVLLAHYAVRTLMFESAIQAGLDPDRLSFISALRILGQHLPTMQMLDVGSLPPIRQRLLAELHRVRLPERRVRINARVVKRRYSPFDLKRPEHAHPPRFDPETPSVIWCCCSKARAALASAGSPSAHAALLPNGSLGARTCWPATGSAGCRLLPLSCPDGSSALSPLPLLLGLRPLSSPKPAAILFLLSSFSAYLNGIAIYRAPTHLPSLRSACPPLPFVQRVMRRRRTIQDEKGLER